MKPLDDPEVFEVFAESPLHLSVVEWLSMRRPPAELRSIARAVARDYDIPHDVLELRLHHVHLPKLAQLGLFTYDGEALAVSDYSTADITDLCERLGEVLPWGDSDQRSTSENAASAAKSGQQSDEAVVETSATDEDD